MVTVGQHQRRAAHHSMDLLDARRIVDRAELVDHSVGIHARSELRVGFDPLGQARGQAEAPDRIDVRTRGAEEREPVGLRLAHRPFMREHGGVVGLGQGERADDPPGVARIALEIPELHAIRVEARRRIGHEHPLALPRCERVGRPRVAVVVLVLVAGEEQPHGVVRGLRLERGALIFVDDVVGWSRERLEVGAGGFAVVPQSGEGEEIGQEVLRDRECRPVVPQQ